MGAIRRFLHQRPGLARQKPDDSPVCSYFRSWNYRLRQFDRVISPGAESIVLPTILPLNRCVVFPPPPFGWAAGMTGSHGMNHTPLKHLED